MGYSADGSLADLGREEPLLEAAYRTSQRVGELLHKIVGDNTPVAGPPPGAAGEWLAARAPREPGHLKRSWKVGEVAVEIGWYRYSIDVYTDDPVAPDVEWPTRPHLIYPKVAGRRLRFWNEAGDIQFRSVVHHPGTQGSYMMTRAVAELETAWLEIGRDEMDRWAAEQTRAF